MDIKETLKKRWQLILIAVVILAIAGVATVMSLGGDDDTAEPLPPSPSEPESSPEPSNNQEPPASPSESPSVSEFLADCQPMGEGFVPDRYVMSNPEVDADVLSLGLDSDGAIAAPPKDQPKTASWWNQGPEPGSTQGKVVLSIHTYRNGGAVGNQMYEGGESQLKEGDIVKVYGKDDEGAERVACYEFVEAQKIMVDDYDPDSDVMVDFEGDPLLTTIICWDHEAGTDYWASRVFFYAKPITP